MKPPSPSALLATLALAALSLAAVPRAAWAGPVVGAVSATATSSTDVMLEPTRAIDQSGLSLAYLPGITGFDGYIGSAPMHAPGGANVWVSDRGDLTPTLWLDLGAEQTIDALALWVEDWAPPMQVDVSVSLDGVSYDSVMADQVLVAGTAYTPVAAQVLGFGTAIVAHHVRLDFTCPVHPVADDIGCGVGEVVFRGADLTVPAPATAALVLLPLALLVARPHRAQRRELAP